MHRLFIVLLLVACTDPKQACLNAATEDLRIVQALIADTQATLARGYAIQTETRSVVYTNFCVGSGRNGTGISFCNAQQPVISKKPVAVNLDDERRKLASLKAKEIQLRRSALLAQQRCELEFPAEA